MRLPAIRDFAAEGSDPRRFAPLGRDWAVAVADVTGSTVLAAAGRARDVNFVAGGAVAVLSTVLAEGDGGIPACQFGGDGAMAAVPPTRQDAARRALAALAHWAGELDVPLRVGMVPVSALDDAGLEVRVALQDFGNGNAFGHFLGSGVAAADQWVKADTRWHIPPGPGALPGLEGLSCRWNPVAPRRGVVLCVIADPLPAGEAGFAVLQRLSAALAAVVPVAEAAPLGDGGRLVPAWLPSRRSLFLESRTVTRGRRLGRVVAAVLGSAAIAAVNALGRPLLGVDPTLYRRSLAARSDYAKEAGGPRFVLDVTEDEATAVEAVLDRFARTGDIVYGTARSAATTVTCLVGDFAADRHVHFVDGADLGFWRASVVLKERRAALKAA